MVIGSKDNEPKKNSLFVNRLINKGAIIIGKTNTAELGVEGILLIDFWANLKCL